MKNNPKKPITQIGKPAIKESQKGIIELINLDGNVLFKTRRSTSELSGQAPKRFTGVFFYRLMCGEQVKDSGQLILNNDV